MAYKVSSVFLTSRVEISSNVRTARRMTKQDDLVRRTTSIFLRGNVVIYPFTRELYVIGTSWIHYMRHKLMVRHYHNNAPLSEKVADIGPALYVFQQET